MKSVNCAFQRLFVALGFLLLFSGCASFQVGGDIQKGRLALLYGDPNVALEHFQRAANSDPNYLLDFSIFDEGVWTYVGRAYYAMGKLPEAQKAFERARSLHRQDHLAKLYLGLVGVRMGGSLEVLSATSVNADPNDEFPTSDYPFGTDEAVSEE